MHVHNTPPGCTLPASPAYRCGFTEYTAHSYGGFLQAAVWVEFTNLRVNMAKVKMARVRPSL